MDLRKRLADLDRLNRRNQDSSKGRSGPSQPSRDKTLESLKLEQESTSGGSVWTRSYHDPASEMPSALPSLAGFFTRAEEANPALEKILFLDTETTGLAGGTGTIAFLVGVGWIRDNSFHSRQYFLPDFEYETAMLQDLARLAEDFEVVMTFNGASFDLPLLRTRALMNRLDDPCGSLVSWDLLVPGRRLWSRTFSDCRQQTLESGLLEMQRGSDDIEGALIPQTWFDFVKTGTPGLMENVLHHNQKDLLGMLGLFSRILEMAARLHKQGDQQETWLEAWAFGRIAERIRLQKTAAHWMNRAVCDKAVGPAGGFGSRHFVVDAVRLLKRQGAWEQVDMVVTAALETGLAETWLHREAAILYEHRLIRLELALEHAHRCQDPVRVLRLEKKIAKL